MFSLRNLFVSSLAASSLVLAQNPSEYAVPSDSQGQFQDLLEALPAESLYAALHSGIDPKFVDGVYEHEKYALEALQNADPPMATRVLAVAALELLKRQATSSNTTAVPASTTTNVPVASTTSTTVVPVPSTTALSTSAPSSTVTATPSSTSDAVVVPIEISTTNSAGSTVVATTSAVATPSASVTSTLTTTNSAGSSVVSTTTAPAAIISNSGMTTTSAVSRFTQPSDTGAVDITTTDAAGQTVVLSSVTIGKVITATDGRGATFVTTYTPGAANTVNSLVLLTTTLPNGVRSTITSFAIVAPASQTASGTNTPKLQNAAARGVGASGGWGMACVVVGAMLAGGMLIL